MRTPSQHILAENVRALELASGLTKTEFALKLGISRVELNLIENGRSNLKLSTLDKIAFALDCEPVDLLRPTE